MCFCKSIKFQSTHPRGCDFYIRLFLLYFDHFNPHTREGATFFSCLFRTFVHISIHTPARVRRAGNVGGGSGRYNFNPHTREGATLWAVATFDNIVNFNPHTREGATCNTVFTFPIFGFRQSTHPRGCDLCSVSGFDSVQISIHTPARVRLVLWSTAVQTFVNFNPHTREGATLHYYFVRYLSQFQSTHPRGCDSARCSKSRLVLNFNPHTREGAT